MGRRSARRAGLARDGTGSTHERLFEGLHGVLDGRAAGESERSRLGRLGRGVLVASGGGPRISLRETARGTGDRQRRLRQILCRCVCSSCALWAARRRVSAQNGRRVRRRNVASNRVVPAAAATATTSNTRTATAILKQLAAAEVDRPCEFRRPLLRPSAAADAPDESLHPLTRFRCCALPRRAGRSPSSRR